MIPNGGHLLQDGRHFSVFVASLCMYIWLLVQMSCFVKHRFYVFLDGKYKFAVHILCIK